MYMRKSAEQISLTDTAHPVRLPFFRIKSIAGKVGAVPVKFMCPDFLSAPAQHRIAGGRQCHIAEMLQFSGKAAAAVQRAGHLKETAVRRLQRSVQIEEPAAFGVHRHAAFCRLPHFIPHRPVLLQLRRVELRIAAAKIQPVDTGGQMRIGDRRKRNDLTAKRPQQVEIILVIKTESRILRTGQTQPARAARRPAGR